MANKNRYQFESKIHVYRATKRMTQQELADLVGVSRQTVMQLERNRYNPSMLLAYSIFFQGGKGRTGTGADRHGFPGGLRCAVCSPECCRIFL